MKKWIRPFVLLFILVSDYTIAYSSEQISGLYNAILFHDSTDYYQHAQITLRTVNPEGKMKISANIRVFFGETNSNEFMTYEFDSVPLNILTKQLVIGSEGNDVSLIGFLRDGMLEGDWFSTLMGKVGKFRAQKSGIPEVPNGAILVDSLSGHYRGLLNNTNPESNLPGKVSLSFVSSQDNSEPEKPKLHISGNVRFYLGSFGSLEYIEVEFNDIQFNYYNRFLTAKTSEYGFTFKGTMTQDGQFDGELFSDGLGEVGTVNLDKVEFQSID